MTNEQAIPRSTEGFSSLDDRLARDGVLEEFQAVAISACFSSRSACTKFNKRSAS
jgi:hypothetical protein